MGEGAHTGSPRAGGDYPPLLESAVPAEPIQLFRDWFAAARETGLPLPHAMSLATVSADGRPSVRTVLLRGYDDNGFVFYTNRDSLKGCQLAENPWVGALFWWEPLRRQVRIDGRVEPVADDAADRDFAARPRSGQVQICASPQSRVVAGRYVLEQWLNEAERLYAGRPVPRPAAWVGYRIVPETVEFWQERADRIHDRLRYRRHGGRNWIIERLAP